MSDIAEVEFDDRIKVAVTNKHNNVDVDEYSDYRKEYDEILLDYHLLTQENTKLHEDIV